MSTRSITSIRSRWDEGDYRTHAVVYRHRDGYLEGHGRWLHAFLGGLQVVNGIGQDMPKRYANGPGRLASQLVAELQRDGHSPDLIGDVDDVGQEFHYQPDVQYGEDGGMVSVTVFDGPVTFFGLGGEDCTNQIFTGTVAEYGEWLESIACREGAANA